MTAQSLHDCFSHLTGDDEFTLCFDGPASRTNFALTAPSGMHAGLEFYAFDGTEPQGAQGNIYAGGLYANGVNDLFLCGPGDPSITLSRDGIRLTNVPTSDPHNDGQLWSDAGTLKLSAG